MNKKPAKNQEIVLFRDGRVELKVPVSSTQQTVWLSANQMALLFEKDEKTIRKHINNVFSDGEAARENNTQKMHFASGQTKFCGSIFWKAALSIRNV